MEKAIYDVNKQVGNNEMNSLFVELLEIFHVENEQKLVEHLSRVNIASNEVCAKVLKGGVGAWECSDCGRDSRCIICNDCYEKSKDKHKNHKKKFKNLVGGCCDCGDPDAWDPNGFCSDHGGIITSEDEIADLINKTFDREILDKIFLVFDKLFNYMTKLIAEYEKDEGEEDPQTNKLIEYIGNFFKYLHVLAQANNAILFIIVNYFMKNFSLETQHTCFSLENDLKIIKRVSTVDKNLMGDVPNDSHPCTCYFLQNFLRICDENFDKFKLDKLFMPFLKSYKFKYLYSFSYISLYKEIILNGNKHIENFSVQVLTNEDVGLAIASSEDLMNSLFDSLHDLINRFIEKEEDLDNILDKEIYEIVFRFYVDIFYLCKPKPTQKISQYTGIFKKLIDVLAIIQNKINFKKATSFQYEGFRESFITIEMYLLYLFSLLTTYFDFSNKKSADEILFYLFNIIIKKNYRTLSQDEYSFHIPLQRALGIFLNRYSFSISVEENYDFYMAIKNVLYYYYNNLFDNKKENDDSLGDDGDSEYLKNYNYEDFLEGLISETFRTLGFINSIPCKNWVYYGENMLYYNYLYYSLEIFRLCDFSLLKLILSQDQSGNLFKIEKILDLSNVNYSYSNFQSYLFNNQILKDFQGKNLFVKNMDIIIRLFRNNSILLDLLTFSYDKLKENKCEDPLFQKLMLKEKNALIEDVKIRLIHIIISKENSIYFSEINKVLPFYIKDYLSQEKIEDIINLICDKVVNKNKTIMFRLKKECFSLIDLYYISNPQKESSAERYLLEFKKNEICLLNTPHLNTFNFIKLVNANMANHFFRNESNINLLLNVTSFTLNGISANVLTMNYNFVINFIKLIDIFVDNCMHSGLLSKHENKFQNKSLIDSLRTFKCTDENLTSFTKRLLERLMNLFSENEKDYEKIFQLNKNDENEAKRQILKLRKEKMAEMYKNKGLAFRKNFDLGEENEATATSQKEKITINEPILATNFNVTTASSSNIEINLQSKNDIANISPNFHIKPSEEFKISLDNQNTSTEKHMDCIICRSNINPDEYLQKPFGRIGVFSKSNFIYHSKLQTLKKEYEKNILSKKNSLRNMNKNEISQSLNLNGNLFTLDHQEQLEMKELMLTYKRSKPELKNGIRYATCNHNIHFSCYLSYILKFMIGNTESKQLIFICPLCKVPSNNYIPYFDYKKEIFKLPQNIRINHSDDILSGIKFEDLFIFYKQILSQNTTINHVNLNFFNYCENLKFNAHEMGDSFIPSVSYFVEHIVSTQLKCSFLINDFKNKLNQEKYYAAILNFFVNSLNLLDILKDDDSNFLDILKDYIIALRILIKTEKLDPQIFFNRLITIQFYWNTDFVSEENIVNNLENDKVSTLLFENLFLILVLFQESQFDYFNIIFRHFTPLIFIQFFLTQLYSNYSFKINSQTFHNQFSFDNLMYILMSPEEANSLRRFLIFYLRKILILKNILNSEKVKTILREDSFNSINSEFDYYINILGLNPNSNLESESNLNNFSHTANNLDFINWLKLDDSIYPQFWIFREDLKDHTIKIFNNYFNVKSKLLEGGENTDEPESNLVNPSLLLINNNLNFHFISIPNNLLDLSMKYYKIICNHCKTSPVYNLLCLTCGEKICYMENCCKNFGKKKNVYEYVWHNKICGNGDGVFLRLNSGEITFAFLGNFMNTKVSIYLNKYGESLKSRSITDDYLLNEELFKSILNEYKNLKYRKNFKINQGLYTMDVEEEELN